MTLWGLGSTLFGPIGDCLRGHRSCVVVVLKLNLTLTYLHKHSHFSEANNLRR